MNALHSIRWVRLKFAQQPEQLARCTRRLLPAGLDTGLSDERAQMLAIRSWIPEHEFVQRGIAFGNQAIAPGFELMHGSNRAMELQPVTVENMANRVDFSVFQTPQLLGEELGLTLASDGLVHGPGAPDFLDQGFIEGNANELGIAQSGQRLGQFENGQRIAAQLAAARAVEPVFDVFV